MTARRSAVHLVRSILCPVDFSTHARVALQHAVAIAHRTDAALTVMYADDPMLAAAAAAGYNQPLLTKQTTRELKRLLTRVGVPIDDDPTAARIVTAIGRPAGEILKTARRVAADVIVMGSQGRSGAGKMFFGSVTEHVLRKTSVPVLAVPLTSPVRTLDSWPAGNIVCAVELGPRAPDDVRAAAEMARAFDCGLTLVHVVSPMRRQPWLGRMLRARDREQLKSARQKLEKLARGVRRLVAGGVGTQALLGHPAQEIAAVASDLRASLIVLTLRRGHGLFAPRQGTITYRVLTGSPVPVLALRQGTRLGSVK
jgi:nucleotide-binding universal stress UspA family protein